MKIRDANRTFFNTALAGNLCLGQFIASVLSSLEKSDGVTWYDIENTKYIATIRIDCSDIIKDGSQNTFSDIVKKGFFAQIALKLHNFLSGDFNESVVVPHSIWVCSFNIVTYERDKAHNFEEVSDASVLLDGEDVVRTIHMEVRINPDQRQF